MPFEARALFKVNRCVVPSKIFFSWHNLVVLVTTDGWVQTVCNLEL